MNLLSQVQLLLQHGTPGQVVASILEELKEEQFVVLKRSEHGSLLLRIESLSRNRDRKLSEIGASASALETKLSNLAQNLEAQAKTLQENMKPSRGNNRRKAAMHRQITKNVIISLGIVTLRLKEATEHARDLGRQSFQTDSVSNLKSTTQS